jgi:2-methylisocitrate lyase-like PEP mutase family enzyme
MPGAFNAAVARLIEKQGYKTVFSTGAGIANTFLGVPDVGLLTLNDNLSVVTQMVRATSCPVLADADDGYGNPLSVRRTVQEFEAVGVAGLIIEDQQAPKKCGHFDEKHLISCDEMVQKIRAACDARSSSDFLIVGRCDAIGVEGFDSAVERGLRYRDAGAEALFIEAPTDKKQLEAIPRRIPDVLQIANMVEGGKTPIPQIADLQQMGFHGALFANMCWRAAQKAMTEVLNLLREVGPGAEIDARISTWSERQNLVGLPSFMSMQAKYAAKNDGVGS